MDYDLIHREDNFVGIGSLFLCLVPTRSSDGAFLPTFCYMNPVLVDGIYPLIRREYNKDSPQFNIFGIVGIANIQYMGP